MLAGRHTRFGVRRECADAYLVQRVYLLNLPTILAAAKINKGLALNFKAKAALIDVAALDPRVQIHRRAVLPVDLDRKVKAPVNAFAYSFGAVSALIMGCGMSLIMTDIGQTIGMASPMTPGIVIGLVGMVMATVNYPIYNGILTRRRKKYAQQIIALSDRLTKGSGRA